VLVLFEFASERLVETDSLYKSFVLVDLNLSFWPFRFWFNGLFWHLCLLNLYLNFFRVKSEFMKSLSWLIWICHFDPFVFDSTGCFGVCALWIRVWRFLGSRDFLPTFDHGSFESVIFTLAFLVQQLVLESILLDFDFEFFPWQIFHRGLIQQNYP